MLNTSTRPSQSEANDIAQRVQETGKVTRSPQMGGPQEFNPLDANNKARFPMYPGYYFPDDMERDRHVSMKARLAEGKSLGEASLTESDINYFIQKENQIELANFKIFLEQSFPRGTPWEREFFEKISPGWYKDKKQIIDEKLDIHKRFIEITLYGPQSGEDAFLLYLLYTGKIELADSFQTLIHPVGTNVSDFKSGSFTPLKTISKTARIADRNRDFMSNFAIPGIDLKGEQGTNAKAIATQTTAPSIYGLIDNKAAQVTSGTGNTSIFSSLFNNKLPDNNRFVTNG